MEALAKKKVDQKNVKTEKQMTKYKVTTDQLRWPNGVKFEKKKLHGYSAEFWWSEGNSFEDQPLEESAIDHLLEIGWLEKLEPEKEKDYTITGFVDAMGVTWNIQPDGKWRPTDNNWQGSISLTVEKCMSTILSILRKIDNKEFKVGLQYILRKHKTVKLTAFRIINEILIVDVEYDNVIRHSTKLSELEPLPERKPLFKTEDNVDIYEGDTWYSITPTQWNIVERKLVDTYHDNKRHFSTRAAAEEFVKWNKPVFSLKEVKSFGENLDFNWGIEARKRCAFTTPSTPCQSHERETEKEERI